MSNDPKHTAEPVRAEWNETLERISEKLREPGATAQPAPSGDVVDELTRLEQRALLAEETLSRERHAYTERVGEMEAKLRKLEPWLRKLRGEYQTVSQERDQLRDRLQRFELSTQASSTAERAAVERELEAANAERDAARAALESLRKQQDNDEQTLHGAWKQRIAAAESARDQALTDLESARQALSDHRRQEDELRHVRTELEQAQMENATHQALSLKAREEAEKAREELATVQAAAGDADEQDKQIAELSAQIDAKDAELTASNDSLLEVRAELAALRDAASGSDLRVADLTGTIDELRSESEKLQSELTDAQRELGKSRGDAEALESTIEKLRAEVSEAKQSVAKMREETNFGRRNVESVKEELENAKRDVEAAQDEVTRVAASALETAERMEALQDQLAAAQEQAAKNMDAESAALLRAETAEKQLEELRKVNAETARSLEESTLHAVDLESDLTAARTDLENAKATLAALEAENAGLTQTLADERVDVEKRIAALEESGRTQLEALASRSDAELTQARVALEEANARAAELAQNSQLSAEAHHAELSGLRESVAGFVGAAVERLMDECNAVLGGMAAMSGPVSLEPLPSGPISPSGSMPIEPQSGAGASATDWDQLLSNLEALRTEVEDFKPDELAGEKQLADLLDGGLTDLDSPGVGSDAGRQIGITSTGLGSTSDSEPFSATDLADRIDLATVGGTQTADARSLLAETKGPTASDDFVRTADTASLAGTPATSQPGEVEIDGPSDPGATVTEAGKKPRRNRRRRKSDK